MGKASRRKRDQRQGRIVKLSPEMEDILQHRYREQEATLGRPPRPHDLVFPDVGSVEAHRVMIAGLLRIGAKADVIAAFEATERVVLPRARQNLDDDDLAEWDDALAAYRRDHPNEEFSDLDALQESFDAELRREALAARPQ
jgi:hypothetical protein